MTHSSNWRDELADTGTELLNVVERKVKASTTAATLVGLVLSVLSLYIFRGGPVPDVLQVVVTALVGAALTGATTFIAGYRAKHTPRVTPSGPPPAGPGTGPAPAPGSPSTP